MADLHISTTIIMKMESKMTSVKAPISIQVTTNPVKIEASPIITIPIPKQIEIVTI